MADSVAVLIVVGVLVAISVLGMLASYAARYKRVPPNQAMVVFGRRFGTKGFIVLTSGGKFIVPILESYMMVSLEPFPIDLDIERVSLRSGSPGARTVRVRATGIGRVSADTKPLDRAATSIAGKSQEQIRALAHRILQDHIRRTFAGAAFAPSYPAAVEGIRAGAQGDLDEFGIRLVSFSMTTHPGDDA
jgi:flotillin